jgi:hypothetical protein
MEDEVMDMMEAPEPMEQPQSGEAALAAAKYSGPESRCDTCTHFDEERMFCGKNGAEVDPGGHCQFYSGADESEEAEKPEMEAPPEIEEDEG